MKKAVEMGEKPVSLFKIEGQEDFGAVRRTSDSSRQSLLVSPVRAIMLSRKEQDDVTRRISDWQAITIRAWMGGPADIDVVLLVDEGSGRVGVPLVHAGNHTLELVAMS
jgi:hypothetical protein